MAAFAKREFNLSTSPSRSTISRLLSRPEDLIACPEKHLHKKKRNTPGVHHDIERSLVNWACGKHVDRRNIDGKIIRARGIKLMNEVNLLLPSDKTLTSSFRMVG